MMLKTPMRKTPSDTSEQEHLFCDIRRATYANRREVRLRYWNGDQGPWVIVSVERCGLTFALAPLAEVDPPKNVMIQGFVQFGVGFPEPAKNQETLECPLWEVRSRYEVYAADVDARCDAAIAIFRAERSGKV